MRSAFVGLVGRRGLEALLPENPTACRWLFERVRSRSHPVACLWAVVDVVLAENVNDLLAEGEPLAALQALSLSAESIGPLAPTETRA